MAPDALISEINEEIEQLRHELVDVEDHDAHSQARSQAIRARIRDLEFERDLIPPPRRP